MNVFKKLSIGLAGVVLMSPAIAAAATSTVYDVNKNDWKTTEVESASFGLTNKYNAPAGFGDSALEMITLDEKGKVTTVNIGTSGTPLSAVDQIEYNTYRESGTNQQVAALNVIIDFNGPDTEGGFSTLVYEPVYNTAQGAVQDKTWQDWDAGDASIWYSTRVIPGAPKAKESYVTLKSLKDANPQATVSAYGFNQGSGNANLTSAVDGLVFGDKTFNFEAKTVKAVNKDDCKNGGWANAFTTNYKNQGACVSSVLSNSDKSENASMMQRAKDLLGL